MKKRIDKALDNAFVPFNALVFPEWDSDEEIFKRVRIVGTKVNRRRRFGAEQTYYLDADGETIASITLDTPENRGLFVAHKNTKTKNHEAIECLTDEIEAAKSVIPFIKP